MPRRGGRWRAHRDSTPTAFGLLVGRLPARRRRRLSAGRPPAPACWRRTPLPLLLPRNPRA
eukprot:10477810-Alexandrium_andersonii.AAC.1